MPTEPRLDERVSDRISALLARCEQLRRGTDCPRPTKFNRDGQRHAEQVAARDRVSHRESQSG